MAEQLDAVRGLGEQGDGQLGLRGGVHGVLDLFQGVSVGLDPLGILVHPGHEVLLLLLFAADDVQLLEGELLTLPLLPAVGGGGVLVGVLELHGRIRAHRLPHEVLPDGAGVDGDAVLRDHLLELGGRLEPLGAARITHDHRVVAFLDALEGDLQVALGLVGTVLRAVGGRLVVGTGVHAEHREVAGVAGPHPVVGLAAELAHGCRRSAHEAHVVVGLGDDQVGDVVVVEVRQLGAAVLVLLRGLVHEGLALGLHQLGDLLLVRLVLADLLLGLLQDGGDVRHRLEEGDAEAAGGEFLVAGHGPVAVHQVVVLVGGERLDAAVAAVVVRDDEAVAGDDLAGAAAAEVDDGILQRGMVDAVDFFGRELAARFFQGFAVHFLEERQEPHSLVGEGGEGEAQGRHDC